MKQIFAPARSVHIPEKWGTKLPDRGITSGTAVYFCILSSNKVKKPILYNTYKPKNNTSMCASAKFSVNILLPGDYSQSANLMRCQ